MFERVNSQCRPAWSEIVHMMEQMGYKSTGTTAFNETRWADSALVFEYERASNQLLEKHDEVLEIDIDERLAIRIVKNLEWHWLQQAMIKHHTGDISLDVITDKTRLNELLASEQPQTNKNSSRY